eukprot:COSAG05_NODE_349_length_10936_cov_9.714404_8_plen_78_part_00
MIFNARLLSLSLSLSLSLYVCVCVCVCVCICVCLCHDQNNQGPNGNPRGHVNFDLANGLKPLPSTPLFSPGPIPPHE